MKGTPPNTPPPNFWDIETFVQNIQRFNALQFNARCEALIKCFGETKGIKYAERFDRYGLWFFIHELSPNEKPQFYQMILDLRTARHTEET